MLVSLAGAFHAAMVPAQVAHADDSSIAAEKGIVTAPISIDGRMLFGVRGVTSFPASERAAAITGRIKAIAEDGSISPSSLRLVEAAHSTNIVAGDTMIMGVFDADAIAEGPGLSRAALARNYLEKISSAIAQYRAERTPQELGRNGLIAGAWTLALAVVLLGMVFVLRRLVAAIETRYRSAIENIESGTFRLINAGSIWIAIRFVVRLTTLIAALAIFYTYLHIVLSLFPWTRALAVHLRALTAAPLLGLIAGIIATIPNLLVIFVIIAAARYVFGLVRVFFSAIESGRIKLGAFEPEWADPTFKIARVFIIAFAVMIAYPYIPGSQSDAFKGITIFLGVLFSLGSSSLLANIIAGYTMTYRRAFHLGDRIMVGEILGDVSQVGLMVTHLRSVKNEELIVPNSLILNSNVINYSSLARERGLILHTSVGIGYETPWRQVEAMLLMAAERTPGLLREPAPFILQKSLADYSVIYELNVYCDRPLEMYRLYTELHRSVLDVFNEYGVQIMTPSYVADAAEPKIVAKEHWFDQPAQPARREEVK